MLYVEGLSLRAFSFVEINLLNTLRLLYTMGPSCKKRKVDGECRVFKKSWTDEYFFVERKGIPTCLICCSTVSVFKEYNLKRHFETNHAFYNKMSPEVKSIEVKKKLSATAKQTAMFTKRSNEAEAATEASFEVAFRVAKSLKPFTDGEFVKDCMMAVVSKICPEKKDAFNSVSLSSTTITRRVEVILICEKNQPTYIF